MVTTAALLVFWATRWVVVLAPTSAASAAVLGGLLGAGVASCTVLWMLRPRRCPVAQLTWDGEGWWLDDQPVVAALQLATAGGLLLRLCSPAGNRWLGISRAEAGGAWHALRVAVLNHACRGARANDGDAATLDGGRQGPDLPLRGA